MAPPIRLIVNPSAGGGRALRRLPDVEQALRGLGVSVRRSVTGSLDDARAFAREAAAEGERVLTLGGDGLAGAVAGVLHGSGTPLGVLPGGRGNDFARKLGLPRDPARACLTLLGPAGRERALDVAHVDGHAFLGIASYGFDSDVQVMANATRRVRGNLVYPYATVRALRAWSPARFEVTLDGESRSFVGYSVAAANSGLFGGGMRLAPDASLDDGLLDVVLIADLPRMRYLASLPGVFRGTHVHNDHVSVVRARELRIDADRPFAVYADGDPIGALPATVGVYPGALRVLTPA